MSDALSLPTWNELRDYVQSVLCDRDRIDCDQSTLLDSMIYRSGRCCGVLFRLRGPRLMQTHAIWSSDESRLLFYDSRGIRFEDEQLAESPDISACIADQRPVLAACSEPV
jgi:hypothetical protein